MSVFNVAQLQALAMLFLKLYGQFFNGSFVFFGFYCLLIGYLIFKSRFLPRILGVGMAITGLGWLTYLWPPLTAYLSPFILIVGIGEVSLTLWLLVAGVDAERWKQQAHAAIYSDGSTALVASELVVDQPQVARPESGR